MNTRNGKNKIPFVTIILIILFVGGGLYGIFHKRKPLFPPHLDDLSTFEYEKLKAAAIAPTSKDSAAIAVSNYDPVHNRIYVSSNAKDGTVLQLRIEEVPGTVIEPQPQGRPQQFPLHPLFRHFTQSPPLHLSPGEYNLSVSLKSNPSPLTERKLFLGGVGADDTDYKKMLAEAQERRKHEAVLEFNELLEDVARFEKEEQVLKSFSALMSQSPLDRKPKAPREIAKLESQWKALEKTPPARDISKAIYSKSFQKIRGLEFQLHQMKADVQDYFGKKPGHRPPQILQKQLTRFDSELAAWKTEINQLNPVDVR